jgi:hypothetical protein
MTLAELARYEWVIMLLIPLGLLLWELNRTKREIREARETQEAPERQEKSGR